MRVTSAVYFWELSLKFCLITRVSIKDLEDEKTFAVTKNK